MNRKWKKIVLEKKAKTSTLKRLQLKIHRLIIFLGKFIKNKRYRTKKSHRYHYFQKIYRFLDKRQRFALQTIILTAGVLLSQLIWDDFRFYLVIALALLSYILTSWSLTEDVKGAEWVLLFILPVLFTTSLSMFYFLLPSRWIVRLTMTVIFAVGTYAILLVENIYNVAAERSIGLLRAAQSVGLLATLIIIFLLSNIIYSLRLNYFYNVMMIAVISFVLSLQSLWSVKLEAKLDRVFLLYAFIISLGVGELALSLAFWPVDIALYSLLLTAGYYSLTGIIQQYFAERLFGNVTREYLTVFIFILLLTFFTTKWG